MDHDALKSHHDRPLLYHILIICRTVIMSCKGARVTRFKSHLIWDTS